MPIRTLGVGQQLEQLDTPLQQETALIVYLSDYRYLSGPIILDKDVDLRISIELEIAIGNLFRKLGFSQTCRLNASINQGHANRSITFNPNGVAREVRPVQDSNLQHITWANSITVSRGGREHIAGNGRRWNCLGHRRRRFRIAT